jgi:hypothetical protein
VFVAEHGHRLARVLKDLDDLSVEFIAWIEFLSLLVPWIVAVLANEHDTIHNQLVRALRQRLADRVDDGKAVLCRFVAAHVIVRDLVGVHRHHLQAGHLPLAIEVVAGEQPPGDDIRMGIAPILRDDDGYFRGMNS